jgi:hypothetical protein
MLRMLPRPCNGLRTITLMTISVGSVRDSCAIESTSSGHWRSLTVTQTACDLANHDLSPGRASRPGDLPR